MQLVPPIGRREGIGACEFDPPGRLDERPPAWQRPIEDREIDAGEPPEDLGVEAV